MEPGTDLDILVAEHVMGAKVDWDPEFTKKYSTDIAEAWKVVEHLVNTTHAKFLIWYDQLTSRWVAEVQNWGICEYSDTPAHAICLAALKATQ